MHICRFFVEATLESVSVFFGKRLPAFWGVGGVPQFRTALKRGRPDVFHNDPIEKHSHSEN